MERVITPRRLLAVATEKAPSEQAAAIRLGEPQVLLLQWFDGQGPSVRVLLRGERTVALCQMHANRVALACSLLGWQFELQPWRGAQWPLWLTTHHAHKRLGDGTMMDYLPDDAYEATMAMKRRKASELTKAELVQMVVQLREVLLDVLESPTGQQGFLRAPADVQQALDRTAFDLDE